MNHPQHELDSSDYGKLAIMAKIVHDCLQELNNVSPEEIATFKETLIEGLSAGWEADEAIAHAMNWKQTVSGG